MNLSITESAMKDHSNQSKYPLGFDLRGYLKYYCERAKQVPMQNNRTDTMTMFLLQKYIPFINISSYKNLQHVFYTQIIFNF